MKILASVVVDWVSLGSNLYTYRSEIHEVEVIRIIRHPATRYPILNRWRYDADIAYHPKLFKFEHIIKINGAYQVMVNREINPRWKPPVFPAGSNVFEVKKDDAV